MVPTSDRRGPYLSQEKRSSRSHITLLSGGLAPKKMLTPSSANVRSHASIVTSTSPRCSGSLHDASPTRRAASTQPSGTRGERERLSLVCLSAPLSYHLTSTFSRLASCTPLRPPCRPARTCTSTVAHSCCAMASIALMRCCKVASSSRL
jgi:hypothetical protein